MSHNMLQRGVSECTKKNKKLITAYVIKDYAIPIFFLVKAMMNAYKIVGIDQSVC